MNHEWVMAFIGGILIGTAGILLLWVEGRIMGISGIVSSLFKPQKGDISWRVLFLVGILFGGLWIEPLGFSIMNLSTNRPMWMLGIGGLLVGFGTSVGSGCTSGHGVCGVSRFSLRSMVATLIFMIFGILTNWLIANVIGGQ